LVWDDFCSWYFELLKPPYGQAIDRASYDAIRNHFETVLRLLHPYMPFITEELWQDLTGSSDGKSVCIANYPEFQNAVDLDLLNSMDKAREFVTEVRNIRNHHQLPPKERLTVYINSASDDFYQRFSDLLCKMANIEELIYTDTKPENAVSFMSGSDECSIPLTVTVDHDAEKQKLEAELEYYQGFLSSIMKKLGNERFVASAPEQVIALERKKQADAEAKIETISKALEK
jgi:valyl-tRNA synthetase